LRTSRSEPDRKAGQGPNTAMREAYPSRELLAAPGLPAPPASVTARDVAAVLFRRRRVISSVFLGVLLTTTSGVIWLMPRLSPVRYTSRLRLMIKKDRFDAVVTPADRAVPGITTAVSAQEVQSEIEILKGADVLDRLAAETRMPAGRIREGLTAMPVVAGRNITSLIEVRYTGSEKDEVSRVLEKLPEIYLQKHLQVNRRPEVLEYFQSQAETFEEELRLAEAELAEFRSALPLLVIEAQQQIVQKLSESAKQRMEAEAAIREAESRAAELARQLSELPPTLATRRVRADTAVLSRLQVQLGEAEKERSQARLHREIEKLDRRLAELHDAIAAESAAAEWAASEVIPHPMRATIEAEHRQNRVALAGLRSRLAVLAAQERTGREELAAARQISTENAADLAAMGRAVKAAEDNARLYRKKYEEAREADLLDQRRLVNVVVAEQPSAPAPVRSQKLWYFLGVGLLLAVGSGAAAGFASERLDHSIHSPPDLESCTGLAVLACIPQARRG
jgi:uncharacterized protein involved in exopolysaccharide biosynthesis